MNLDITVFLNGYHGDLNETYFVSGVGGRAGPLLPSSCVIVCARVCACMHTQTRLTSDQPSRTSIRRTHLPPPPPRPCHAFHECLFTVHLHSVHARRIMHT